MAILGYDNCKLETREYGMEGMLKRRGFDGWLEIAIDDLAAPARERIARELETHYADPRAAAMRFRKRHLTEGEAKQIQTMERRASKPLLSAATSHWNTLPFAGMAFLLGYIFSGSVHARLLAVVFLLIFTGFRLVPRVLFNRMRPGISRLRGYAWCHLLATSGVGIACIQELYSTRHDVPSFAKSSILQCYWLFYWWSRSQFVSLAKLRSVSEAANETPPKATASS